MKHSFVVLLPAAATAAASTIIMNELFLWLNNTDAPYFASQLALAVVPRAVCGVVRMLCTFPACVLGEVHYTWSCVYTLCVHRLLSALDFFCALVFSSRPISIPHHTLFLGSGCFSCGWWCFSHKWWFSGCSGCCFEGVGI